MNISNIFQRSTNLLCISCCFWDEVEDYILEEIGLTRDSDGEFYMSFNQHFLKYFGEIEVVHISPTNTECSLRDFAKAFDVFHMFGEWRGETAEGGIGQSLGIPF